MRVSVEAVMVTIEAESANRDSVSTVEAVRVRKSCESALGLVQIVQSLYLYSSD